MHLVDHQLAAGEGEVGRIIDRADQRMAQLLAAPVEPLVLVLVEMHVLARGQGVGPVLGPGQARRAHRFDDDLGQLLDGIARGRRTLERARIPEEGLPVDQAEVLVHLLQAPGQLAVGQDIAPEGERQGSHRLVFHPRLLAPST